MGGRGIPLLLLLLILLGAARCAVDDVREGFRYEEYRVEHEISSAQARAALVDMNRTTVVIPAGCQECTSEEISYCTGANLIHDHCCCDKRYHEVLPFIPHTCYWGTTRCVPIKECDEYNRLRRCCCDKYVLEKWKERSRGTSNASQGSIILLLCFVYSVSRIINYCNV